MAIDLAPRPWIGSIAVSFDPAISYSTSVRMLVIASPRSGGWARKLWRQNRNPLWPECSDCSTGAVGASLSKTVAVGRAAGTIGMMINPDNPTVSTASNEMISAARDAPGWETQRWSHAVRVPITTLDLLMARHGVPTFVKIDVEGFEHEVLLGLSRTVNAMSFEFTTIQRGVALACVERCVALGFKHFNAALGESQALVHSDWVTGGDIAAWIAALPHSANSGDIYVSLA